MAKKNETPKKSGKAAQKDHRRIPAKGAQKETIGFELV